MTDQEVDIGQKLDKLIDAVHQQNIILAEHTEHLENVGRELAILRDVQRSHGTEVEHLAREVHQLKMGTLRSQKLTPVPRLDPALVGREGD